MTAVASVADDRTLLVACGALARELAGIVERRALPVDVECLPAALHNRPDRIPEAVRDRIRAARRRYTRIVVGYADCGTGGRLDAVCEEEGVARLPGPHCYAVLAGADRFAHLHEEELGTLYLTDYLARHGQRLLVEGLGLDRHPELRDLYFAHYRRVVHLAQTDDPAVDARARALADRLGLRHERIDVGPGDLDETLVALTVGPVRASERRSPLAVPS